MSIDRRMDKEVVVHIHNGLLAIKRNVFESVLMKCMNLKPLYRAYYTEVSQKEKDKYHIIHKYVFTHIWNIEKWC